jgi:hypothetical protein
LIVYVNVYGGGPAVPVNVTFGGLPLMHIAVVPLMLPVGSGYTFIVALPISPWLHPFASSTLTNEYTYAPDVPVGAPTLTVFPELVVTVWFTPPLIVYVNVYGPVPLAPVNVIFGELPFKHTLTLPPILPVGNGLTVNVVDPPLP